MTAKLPTSALFGEQWDIIAVNVPIARNTTTATLTCDTNSPTATAIQTGNPALAILIAGTYRHYHPTGHITDGATLTAEYRSDAALFDSDIRSFLADRGNT